MEVCGGGGGGHASPRRLRPPQIDSGWSPAVCLRIMSGSGGLCSLECGAKIVAWIQVIGCGIAMVAWGIVLVVALSMGPPKTPLYLDESPSTDLEGKEASFNLGHVWGHHMAEHHASRRNLTKFEVEEREIILEQEETAYKLTIFVLVIVFIFHLIVWILAFLLLRGIYKIQMTFVTAWLIAKGILLALAAGTVLIRIFALLFNIDSDLTYTITWLVVDSLQVFVVFNFWQEKKGDFIPA